MKPLIWCQWAPHQTPMWHLEEWHQGDLVAHMHNQEYKSTLPFVQQTSAKNKNGHVWWIGSLFLLNTNLKFHSADAVTSQKIIKKGTNSSSSSCSKQHSCYFLRLVSEKKNKKKTPLLKYCTVGPAALSTSNTWIWETCTREHSQHRFMSLFCVIWLLYWLLYPSIS